MAANRYTDVWSKLAGRLSPYRKDMFFVAQRARDDWYFKQAISDFRRKRLIKRQTIDVDDHINNGSDLATARFVILQLYGKVQDNNGTWLSRYYDLPSKYVESFKLISIDASNSRLMTEGTDNFAGLDQLRSLNLSHNPNLDDFACDQLAREFRKSSSLELIDLSYNKHISIHGLNVLLRIPTLKYIRAVDTRASDHPEIDLFTLAAQEERDCQVYTHECGRQYISDDLENLKQDLLTEGQLMQSIEAPKTQLGVDCDSKS